MVGTIHFFLDFYFTESTFFGCLRGHLGYLLLRRADLLTRLRGLLGYLLLRRADLLLRRADLLGRFRSFFLRGLLRLRSIFRRRLASMTSPLFELLCNCRTFRDARCFAHAFLKTRARDDRSCFNRADGIANKFRLVVEFLRHKPKRSARTSRQFGGAWDVAVTSSTLT